MIYNVYVVYDKVAEEAGPPFTAVNDAVAQRMFAQMNIPLSLRSEYDLVRVAFYDSKDMLLSPDSPYCLTQKGKEDSDE
nr:MAG: nonstructural protein [Microvirus sp.]